MPPAQTIRQLPRTGSSRGRGRGGGVLPCMLTEGILAPGDRAHARFEEAPVIRKTSPPVSSRDSAPKTHTVSGSRGRGRGGGALSFLPSFWEKGGQSAARERVDMRARASGGERPFPARSLPPCLHCSSSHRPLRTRHPRHASPGCSKVGLQGRKWGLGGGGGFFCPSSPSCLKPSW